MKILHCITLSTLGGAQSVVCALANYQAQEEHQVYIISSKEQTAWKYLDRRIKIYAISELKRKLGLLDIIVFVKLVYYRLKIKPDVIHLHSSKMGVLGRLAFPSSKIVYTVHGFDSICISHRSFLFLERLLQHQCKYIVGVSQYDKKNLIQEGISKNVKCIYNGIADVEKTESYDDMGFITFLADIRKRFEKTILCIARDDPPKKMDLFTQIAEKNKEYAFVWIGNKDKHQEFENLFWVGMKTNASQYLDFCDLFLLPSNFEGLPMSIIEALSHSKPVIASNVGGINEMLDGNNGFAVYNDVESFTKKIDYLFSNDKFYEQACKNARKSFLDLYVAKKMNEEYAKIYKEIARQSF